MMVKFSCEFCQHTNEIDVEDCEDTFECVNCGQVNYIDEECLFCGFLCVKLVREGAKSTKVPCLKEVDE